MVAKLLVNAQDGTPPQISFADHAGDFGPAAANVIEIGTPTDGQLSLSGITDTSWRQSVKVDLGANFADLYECRACFEFPSAPTAGERIYCFWNASGVTTAGTGNMGGASGSDATYNGYGAAAADALEASEQLIYIGSFVVTADAGVQIGHVGWLTPPHRYGSLIVRNKSGLTLGPSTPDDVEMNIVLDPVVKESQ